MKVNKLKVMSTIGALGLTASVLAGCGAEPEKQANDEFVKVVNSEGETMYIDEQEFEEANEDDGGGGLGMFILFSSWNGNNHSGLQSSKGYKGSAYKTKPTVSSGAKAGAKSGAKSGGKTGIGGKSGGKSGGFGG